MTDTLQTENEEGLETGTGSGTVDNDGADLATATGENQPKSEDSGGNIDQAKVNEAINKQHFKFRQEQRQHQQTRQQLEDAQKRLSELQAKSNDVVIPPLPDPYDDDFDAKVRERDEAIRRKAAIDAEKVTAQTQQSATLEADQQAALEQFQAKARKYDERINTLGVKREEVEKAAGIVAQYELSQDMIDLILENENGPLITQYLAANPLELDGLTSMSTAQAAIRLHSVIVPAAASLKPQASNAPDPIEDIGSGRGVGEKTSPFLKGARFE